MIGALKMKKKHSETAIFAALYRAVAYKEFESGELGPDYLAENFCRFILGF